MKQNKRIGLLLLLLLFREQEVGRGEREKWLNEWMNVNKMMRKWVKEPLSNGDTSSSAVLLCWSLICLPFVRLDSKQTWAIEWFVFLFSFVFFFFFSSLFHSSVTPCPSFVKYERRRSFRILYVQPPRRRRRRRWRLQSSLSYFFSFSFVSPYRHVHSMQSFTLRWREKEKNEGRTFATTAIKFMPISLRYSSLQ